MDEPAVLAHDAALRLPLVRVIDDYLERGAFATKQNELPIQDELPTYVASFLPQLRTYLWMGVFEGDPKSHKQIGETRIVWVAGDVSSVCECGTDDFVKGACAALTGFCPVDFDPALVDDFVCGSRKQLTKHLMRETGERSAIVVEKGLLYRYATRHGRIRAIYFASTSDVTKTYFFLEDARAHRTRRDFVDHRVGNLLRTATLLLETRSYGKVADALHVMTTEIDVRRGHHYNLSIAPVSLEELVAPVTQTSQCVIVDSSGPPHSVYTFYAAEGGRQIPFELLRVAALLDIFSNVAKHGNGYCTLRRYDNRVQISNTVNFTPERPKSLKTGLRALERECNAIGVKINFARRDDQWIVDLSIVSVRHTDVMHPETTPQHADDATAAKSYDWILCEDQDTIATLWKRLFKQIGIALTLVVTPPQVAHLADTVAYRLQLGKPLVLIMDENLFEFRFEGDDLENAATVPVTGTELRERLLTSTAFCNAVRRGSLFFVAASASEVHDPLLVANVGKAGRTSTMLQRILQGLRPPPLVNWPDRGASHSAGGIAEQLAHTLAVSSGSSPP